MKRLITCSDGTWNKPDMTDRGKEVQTNVEKMFNCICPVDSKNNIRQLKVYDQGVGTGYSKKDKILGGLTGSGIDKNIKDVYTFLVLNYEPGDEIYLFGFSRGAYTARSLAGFIRNCGILKPENMHLLDKAYELYRDRNQYTKPDSDMMESFKNRFSHEPKIKFIGVWDTVGSLGFPLFWLNSFNMERYKFHDQKLSKIVEHAYHALSINERRKLFAPTLWEKSDAVLKEEKHTQVMEQRWFAGVHSNVGGGYCDSGLSDITLQWLIDKAHAIGLCFHDVELDKIKPKMEGELRNSLSLMYYLWKPIWREILVGEKDTKGLYNQEIDPSVWKRYEHDAKFRPGNLKEYALKKYS